MGILWAYQRFVVFRKLKAEWEVNLSEVSRLGSHGGVIGLGACLTDHHCHPLWGLQSTEQWDRDLWRRHDQYNENERDKETEAAGLGERWIR